jgi:general secretion pathway protein F
MSKFHYKALMLDGREIAGETEAVNNSALADALAAAGAILIEAQEEKAQGAWRGLFSFSIDAGQVTTFLIELGLLLRGGQPIDEALMLLTEGRGGALAAVIRALRSDILAGVAPADAFAAHPSAFPPDVVALLRVAEVTGRLDRAVEAAASQRVRRQALSQKLSASLRYPVFLLLMAIGVIIFFLQFVIPQFSGIIEDSGSEPDWAFSLAMSLSKGLNENFEALQIGVVVIFIAGFVCVRMPGVRLAVGRLVSRLPVVSGILELRLSAIFCLTLSTLISQGVTLPGAVKVLSDVVGANYRDGLERIGDAVRRGASLSDALDQDEFLPAIARRMVRIGEESGELEPIAARAGQLYEAKLDQRLDRITAIVGPCAIIFVAGLIATLMVTIMSALMNVNQMVE